MPESPPLDTLSDLLRVVRFSGGMFFRIEMTAPYAVSTLKAEAIASRHAPDAEQMLPFHLVTSGETWFAVEGSDPVKLSAGDIIVLPHGSDHYVTSKPGLTRVNVTDLDEYVDGDPPKLRYGGGGPASEALCGFFFCRSQIFNPLIDALPEVLIIRGGDHETALLTTMLERAYNESLTDRPGGVALIERLTELLFVEVVQRHLEDHSPRSGWLSGLRDPVVQRCLSQIHAKPAHAWSVADLARKSGASRTVLAERFAQSVGMTPIRYLTAWRMELAAQRLRGTNDAIAEIACDVGYDSESSFNRAFKRHTGVPPATWRKAQNTA